MSGEDQCSMDRRMLLAEAEEITREVRAAGSMDLSSCTVPEAPRAFLKAAGWLMRERTLHLRYGDRFLNGGKNTLSIWGIRAQGVVGCIVVVFLVLIVAWIAGHAGIDVRSLFVRGG